MLWVLVGLGLGGDDGGFLFFTEAVTVSFDRDDGGVMEESVQSGAGQDWIVSKDLAPLTEGLVRGNHSGDAFFVTFGDDLKKPWKPACDQGAVNRLHRSSAVFSRSAF